MQQTKKRAIDDYFRFNFSFLGTDFLGVVISIICIFPVGESQVSDRSAPSLKGIFKLDIKSSLPYSCVRSK